MKVRTWCVVMGLLMLTTFLKADLEIFDICTKSADQVEPDIDGDWIVWQDARNGTSNYDIYGYTLAEPNEIEICTVQASNQRYANLSGNVVVWQDERNSQRDIYAFDLLNRSPLMLPNMPLSDNLSQRYPDISGDVIVYRHDPSGSYNLFTYELASETPQLIHTASTSPVNFTIDGSRVVWMEQVGSVYQIFMKDVSQSESAVRISETSYEQWFPAVSGNLIVWAEDRGQATGMDLYGFDINNLTAGEFSVYVGPGEQTRPAISGNLVVWQDKPEGETDNDIRGLELSTGDLFEIAVDSEVTYDDQKPAISGRTVVWQRKNTDWDIVGAEIPASTITVIDIASPDSGEHYLANNPMEIAWQLVEGDAPEFVNVKFSRDNGDTWPVSVATDIPFVNYYHRWDSVADVNSVECRISISAVGGGAGSGISDAFTVFQCSKNLTADLTGDCFVGMDDVAEMAAQWLACGNPYDENCRRDH